MGEFIGIAKINKEVIKDLNNSTIDVLRDVEYSSYFEGALQRVFCKSERGYNSKKRKLLMILLISNII